MFATRIVCSLGTALLAASAAHAGWTITVTPSIGPNAAPSAADYGQNAFSVLAQGLVPGTGNPGTPNTPAYYQAVSGGAVRASDLVATDFPSWLGNADPAGAFGPAFANELGNQLYFGVVIVNTDPTETFSISQLKFQGTTTDPSHALDFKLDPGFFQYSADNVGLIFNADGSVTQITSGADDQLVNALVSRGVGAAYKVSSTDPGSSDQDRIDRALPTTGYSFTGTYSLINSEGASFVSGSAPVTVGAVSAPEPTSALLFGIGLVGLAVNRRLRR